ncbi:exo-beta-N-acetylmuramidase NamZ family protein [Pseudochryseolinea flava]|uniref:DUF1343 domain-containing protein n=1 Tax=Pseudochryseolinea flava TaxID=2059302 RepID=A0A364XVI4_9BACT|nr:DUF1343 domain-containing protein [Pseudochryseolinea flava]RAV98365.1 DUF1343 domain-containing protein [Pseudochryseolinea flava]
MIRISTFVLLVLWTCQCTGQPPRPTVESPSGAATVPSKVLMGADQLDKILPLTKGKNVALVVNHTSLVNNQTHLADTLISLGVTIRKIFAPEHGFRGMAANGEHVKDGVDTKTGLPIVSLYGANRKPTTAQVADVDVIIFDIQDVGARFYTYISTMHYMMESCAENNKQLIVLDRPNPHGGYFDGPILQPAFKSFVGMHAIPIVHGLTVAELAQMINGEGWLAGGKKCELKIVKVHGWKHHDEYVLPVKPSPNLPNQQSIKLYPSVCLLEQTVISIGRGTEFPFQVLGNPLLKSYAFQFTPINMPGVAVNPPHENKLCYGLDLRQASVPTDKIDLQYIFEMYKAYPEKDKFFIGMFDKIMGNDVFKKQLKDGLTEAQIRDSWKDGLAQYEKMRAKYLLYP